MATKREYLNHLRIAVEQLHDCSAVHVYTSAVHVEVENETIWEGDVEVFAIVGHPNAARCYAWVCRFGKDYSDARFMTVLAIPPVTSPEAAVRTSLAPTPVHAGK